MYRSHVVTMVASLLLINLGSAHAQDAAQQSDAQRQANAEQKVIHVCSLNSTEANQEFQRNVRLVRLQRQNVVELQAALDKATDEEAKKTLQTQLDAAKAKLVENSKIMLETYGFSLSRDYTQVIEKSHIYMILTEEEAVKFAERQKGATTPAGGQTGVSE